MDIVLHTVNMHAFRGNINWQMFDGLSITH